MPIKYIQKDKNGKWKVSLTKSGKATIVADTQKEAIARAGAQKTTEGIMIKRSSGWVAANGWDQSVANAAAKVVGIKHNEHKKTTKKQPKTKKASIAKKTTTSKKSPKKASNSKTTAVKKSTKKVSTSKTTVTKKTIKKTSASKTTATKKSPKKASTSKSTTTKRQLAIKKESTKKTKLKKLYVTYRKDEDKWYIVGKSLKVDYELKNKAESIKYLKTNFKNVKVLVQNQDSKWSYSFVIGEKKEIHSFKMTKNYQEDEVSKKIVKVINAEIVKNNKISKKTIKKESIKKIKTRKSNNNEVVVKFKNITKKFGTNIANNNINFEVYKNEIHAILGENGAGKSTLMSILFGLYTPTSGEIYINGNIERIKDPRHANELKIAMLPQHFKLVENMSVLENVILGYEKLNRFHEEDFLDEENKEEKIIAVKKEKPKKVKLKKLYVTHRKDEDKWYIVGKSLKVDYELKNKAESIKYLKANFENVKVLVQNQDSKWSYSFIIGEKKEIHSFKMTKNYQEDEVSDLIIKENNKTKELSNVKSVESIESKVKIKQKPIEALQEIADKFNIEIDLKAKVSTLPISDKQKVEILKILWRDADIIIFDEPTSILTPQEIVEFLKMVKYMKSIGKTIIIITHKLPEIKAVADRVTIIRKGKYISTSYVSKVSEKEMAKMMVGKAIDLNLSTIKRTPIKKDAKNILEIVDLNYKPSGYESKLEDINLEIKEGEILGIAAIDGNGQSELIKAIAGMIKYTGNIKVDDISLDNMNIKERYYNSKNSKISLEEKESFLEAITNFEMNLLEAKEKYKELSIREKELLKEVKKLPKEDDDKNEIIKRSPKKIDSKDKELIATKTEKQIKKEQKEKPKKVKLKKLYVTYRKDEDKWYVVGKSLKVDYELKNKAESIKYLKANFENVKVLVQNQDSKWSYSFIIGEKKEIHSFKMTKNYQEDEVSKKIVKVINVEVVKNNETSKKITKKEPVVSDVKKELLKVQKEKEKYKKLIDKYNVQINHTKLLIKKPKTLISHIPEDRHLYGLVLDYSVAKNAVLQDIDYYTKFLGIINMSDVNKRTNYFVEKYNVRGVTTNKIKARALSGGNQQKLILAREIERSPKLLLSSHLSRGLDVGAIRNVYKSLIDSRNRGLSVLLNSGELDEIMQVSDRIIVMHEGKIVSISKRGELSKTQLGALMAGGKK